MGSFDIPGRGIHDLFCCMTCCWPSLLELAKQPLFLSFSKLQNFNSLYPPHNHLLNPPLVVALRYSVPIIFLLLDKTYIEICQGKRDICQGNIRNCQGNLSSRFGRHPEIQFKNVIKYWDFKAEPRKSQTFLRHPLLYV